MVASAFGIVSIKFVPEPLGRPLAWSSINGRLVYRSHWFCPLCGFVNRPTVFYPAKRHMSRGRARHGSITCRWCDNWFHYETQTTHYNAGGRHFGEYPPHTTSYSYWIRGR